ncbi:MAG: hypothetical protein LIO77_08010 [Rikenellaceae bacterium]|nr:hypothetical protein [Rikenellaceae bacterium]
MKKIFFIATMLFLLSCSALYSQRDFSGKIKNNTNIFHGKWIAKQGNITYELIIKREMFKLSDLSERETVWGRIIYKENGNVVRETPDNIENAIIKYMLLELPDPYRMNFWFNDTERKVNGFWEFIIDKNDLTKAVSKNGKLEEIIRVIPAGEDPNKPYVRNTYDIPDGMTWTKVE